MTIGLTPKLVETASKVTTSINADGDKNYGTSSSSACLYRDITTINEAANRREVSVDGYLWFESTENVKKGDIYYHPSEGYLQIERVTKAKRLVLDNAVKFIKCEVTKQRQVS